MRRRGPKWTPPPAEMCLSKRSRKGSIEKHARKRSSFSIALHRHTVIHYDEEQQRADGDEGPNRPKCPEAQCQRDRRGFMASLLQQTASTDRENAQEKISYPAVTPEMKLVQEALFRHVGKPIPRKEDGRLITGKGRFSDDFSLPGQTYAAMVRSPYPHARILGIDTSEALESPGVLAGLDRSGHIGRRDCADTAQPRSLDEVRYEADRAGWRQAVCRSTLSSAERQGPPCWRGRSHGDRRDGGAGHRCCRKGGRRL